MKNAFYAIVFVLALATAYAISQNPQAAPNNAPPAGQQATQPATDSPPATTTERPVDQAAPGAPASEAHSHHETAGSSSDAALQKQLQQQFASANLSSVAIAVNKGVVTLTGTVATKEDRKRAKDLAKSVPGVQRVDDKLEIKPPSANAGGLAHATTQQSTSPSTAGSIAGNTTAASGTQAPSATQSPANVANTTKETEPSTSGTAGTTGGVTGPTAPATQATGTQSTEAQSSTGTESATGTQSAVGATAPPATGNATTVGAVGASAEGTDLQPQIENALRSEPTLANARVTVTVTGDTIELSGSVPTGKEKTTAKRIAQSFAGNRRVVDRITVSGRGVGPNGSTPSASTPPSGKQPSASPDPNAPPKQQDKAKSPAPTADPNSHGDTTDQPR